jgi:hypothetical protein
VAEANRRFRFAQFEFPWALGPDDGRYVLRESGQSEPSHVLVLRTLGAPQRRLMGGRRPRAAAPEPSPEPVTTTRATVIDVEPLGVAEAEGWLAGLGEEERDRDLAEALRVLNRALHAHRLAAADAWINDVSRDQALVVRLGHGRGDQVADGRWAQAIEVPLDRRRRERRLAALRPQERVAALLGGRDKPLAAEELTLRARLDMEAGRVREAALQLRVALEAGIAELDNPPHGAEMPRRLAELRDQRGAVGAAANAAVAGELPDESRKAIEHALSRLEAAVRARAAAGPLEFAEGQPKAES